MDGRTTASDVDRGPIIPQVVGDRDLGYYTLVEYTARPFIAGQEHFWIWAPAEMDASEIMRLLIQNYRPETRDEHA